MKTNLQGLAKEDLALLLYGIRAIYVADMEPRRVKLEERLLSELAMYGISNVYAHSGTDLAVETKITQSVEKMK